MLKSVKTMIILLMVKNSEITFSKHKKMVYHLSPLSNYLTINIHINNIKFTKASINYICSQ